MTRGSEADYLRFTEHGYPTWPRRTTLLTEDGVPIEALYEPSAEPVPQGGDSPAIVLAHGFTGSVERPALRRAALAFAQRAAVITFSFRGHGGSGGRSTVGDREVLDLAAAVAWARRIGHRRIAAVGFSMGGSVVIRHAALYGGTERNQPRSEHGIRRRGGRMEAHTTAVVAISAPARWYYRGTAPMRRLHWAVTRPAGRLVSRYGLRTRVHPRRWDPEPLPPYAAVPYIAPTPLLIVHGDRDPYFPLDHPRMLAAAGDPSSTELWIEPGLGHAENAVDAALLGRVAAWAASHA